MLKTCSKCQIEKYEEEFSKREGGRYRSSCKECTRKDNLERYYRKGGKSAQAHRARKFNLKQYGLTVEQYDALFEKQQGKCAICATEEPSRNKSNYRLFVDHCHDTGKVRGLLCHHCNVGLGHFKDNWQLLTKAIEYLNEDCP